MLLRELILLSRSKEHDEVLRSIDSALSSSGPNKPFLCRILDQSTPHLFKSVAKISRTYRSKIFNVCGVEMCGVSPIHISQLA